MRQSSPAYSATRAPAVRSSTLPVLTADDIARLTGTPLRSAQRHLAELRIRGVPVVRLTTGDRGQPPWGVSVENYCTARGIDPETLGR